MRTGLSDTIAGHVLSVKIDEDAKTAQVTVTRINGVADPASLEAVKVAAMLLAQRAARFLGHGWIIREWDHEE